MPLDLPPLNRRRFLAGTIAAGAWLLLSRRILALEPKADPNCVVLLADTHICEKRNQERHGVKTVEHLEQTVREILALKPRPSGAFFAGDIAFLKGMHDDYAMFGELVKPLRKAGMPLHFALGNHDVRRNFLDAIPEAKSQAAVDPKTFNKYVSVVETPPANWFLLDSLNDSDPSYGLLGQSQLTWLAKALDARADKPALVMAHHHPQRLIHYRGLADTEELFKVLMPRKQVKAFFFGHLHQWRLDRQQGVHLVHLPAVAWVLDPTQPYAYVTALLRPDGASLALHSLDPQHPKHGEKVDLKWRA